MKTVAEGVGCAVIGLVAVHVLPIICVAMYLRNPRRMMNSCINPSHYSHERRNWS